jgi:uroporphyrinogen-III synthase
VQVNEFVTGGDEATVRTRKGVLVTRPATQATALLDHILGIGAVPIPFPLLKIEEIPVDYESKQVVMNLDAYDCAIFISGNAVEFGMNRIESYWPQFPLSLRWFCVGKATARKLADHGVSVISPAKETSEGLLELAELADVKDKKILIVRGLGGREILANCLQERGASVQYLNVYRRDPEPWEWNDLVQLRERYEIDVLMITSAAALNHFDSLVEDADFRNAIKVILPSQRLMQLAAELGYSQCFLSNGADDTSMLEACRPLVTNR